MAEETKKSEQAPEAAAAAGGKKFPLKPILILLAVVLIEGVAISGAFIMSGKPAAVSASTPGAQKDEALKLDQPIEELVVSDRFQNTRTGRTYLYDTEIYIVVRQKNDEQAKKILEANKARIRQDIRTIISQAEPAELLEPTLATLTRQIRASLDDHLGHDPQDGKPLIEKVLITKCTQYRVDM
jgi:flagellar basal body-associated protein FliL